MASDSAPAQHPDHQEIELKLHLPADQIERVRRHPLVETRSRAPAATKSLYSVYFDTPTLALAERGVALRVRRTPGGLIQTLKTRGTGHGGLFSRLELEAPVSDERPDLDAIADPDLRDAVRELAAAEGLAEVVVTEFQRFSRRLHWDGNEVLFELDEGEVRTGRATAPIAELELELVSGQPTALFDLALELAQDVTLHPAREGKVDRGFALLRDELPQALRAPKLEHPKDATLSEVIGNVVASAIEQIQANQEIARAGLDPEGVHQMRVGLRRLRAAFSTFRRVVPREAVGPLHDEARWLAGELGFVRDLDVFLLEILEPLCARYSEHAGLKRLREHTQTLRDASHEELRTQLASPRYGRFLLALARWHHSAGWLDQPLSPEGARLYRPARRESRDILRRLHRKARKLGARLDESSIEEKHALRIRLKKLRYASEFTLSLHGRRAGRRYARHLADLQDVLGQLNDVATAKRLLDLLSEWMGREAPTEAHRATGLVEGWIARGSEDALRDLDRLWRRFERTPVFWEPRDGQ